MSEVGLLGLRALVAGTFVVLLSLLGEALRPKSFAGVFAAAPSVALASLLVTDLAKGEPAVWSSALGMVAGAVAMLVACVVGIDAVKRFRALRGALVSIAAWLVAAAGLYAVAFR